MRRPPCGAGHVADRNGWPAPLPDRGRGAEILPVRPCTRPASSPSPTLASGLRAEPSVSRKPMVWRTRSSQGRSPLPSFQAEPMSGCCAHLCCRRWFKLSNSAISSELQHHLRISRTHLGKLCRREGGRARQGEKYGVSQQSGE